MDRYLEQEIKMANEFMQSMKKLNEFTLDEIYQFNNQVDTLKMHVMRINATMLEIKEEE